MYVSSQNTWIARGTSMPQLTPARTILCICALMYVCMRVCMCICVYYVCMYAVCSQNIHTHIPTHTYIHTQINSCLALTGTNWREDRLAFIYKLNILVPSHGYIYTHTCTYTYIRRSTAASLSQAQTGSRPPHP